MPTEADYKVLQSRLEAYQLTCGDQGAKLAALESLLMAESEQGREGMNVTLLPFNELTFKDDTLAAVAEILKRKIR